MQLAVLASGGLGMHCLKQIRNSYAVACILTDKSSTGIIQWANEKGIPVFAGNPRNGKAAHFIKSYKIDILLSINYLFIIEQDLIKWPARYAMNIHGSLLPKYRGRTPHVWAIINNEKTTGATLHFIEGECDAGPIALQREFEIDPAMRGADILERFQILYPQMINEALDQAMKGTLTAHNQDHSKATYFGKRIPDDGGINWQWQKERIYNWVRAQAHPYPGAFSFYKNHKIIINKISFSEHGFQGADPNGLILDVTEHGPIVKTSNGAIRIEELVLPDPCLFKKGELFHE